MPGFGNPYEPGLNVERATLNSVRACLEAFRDGSGPDMDLLLDLNFNARTEGYLRLIRELADLDLFWVEIDHDQADGLARVRQRANCAISGGETLFGVAGFLPYFQAGALDVAIIDTDLERRLAGAEDGGGGGGFRARHRPAQLLRPPVHDDERPLRRRGAESADHGDRHRPAGLGRRAGDRSRRCTRPAICWCPTTRVGAPSRSRRRSSPIRPGPVPAYSTSPAPAPDPSPNRGRQLWRDEERGRCPGSTGGDRPR